MNQKTFNKNTTGTQAAYAPEETMHQNKGLSYKFEIMDDKNIYSVLFEGKLTDKDTKKLLATLRNCLYEGMADCIQTYLKQHNIAYSDFISSKIPLEHNKVMELAELLLDSNTCSRLDKYIGDTNIFYAIVDHQKWITENCCQGCYFAVKRIYSKCKNLYQYNIIGQTFSYNKVNGNETGYFAIRKNRNDGFLNNIAFSSDKPVLPTFGCVDMMDILLNIDIIITLTQVKQMEIK